MLVASLVGSRLSCGYQHTAGAAPATLTAGAIGETGPVGVTGAQGEGGMPSGPGRLALAEAWAAVAALIHGTASACPGEGGSVEAWTRTQPVTVMSEAGAR